LIGCGGKDIPSSHEASTPGRVGRVHPNCIAGCVRKSREKNCFCPIRCSRPAGDLSVAALDGPREGVSLRVIDGDAPGEVKEGISGAVDKAWESEHRGLI